MTDFKTYRPSIQFTQEMLADYLYVLSFKGTTPSEIYLTTEREENKIPPIYSQEGIFIFQPPYSKFIIKFTLQDDYEGSLQHAEPLLFVLYFALSYPLLNRNCS